MTPVFFASQYDFRDWLEKNHKLEKELFVGFYKVGSDKHNMTWSQSVDQALCFGWIDGIRKSIDEISYCIRFTPRKKTSIWSAINIKKVEELSKLGLMQAAGIEAFSYRKAEKSGVYSFETDAKTLTDGYLAIFKKNKKAWEFFSTQAPSYQRTIFHWVLSAKQEKTKLSRLEKLIAESEKQQRIF